MTETRKLSGGQRAVLIAATVPMVGFAGLGAWGTFTNVESEFGPARRATALGVVAAGEGATLVLALVMVLLIMFGQAAPWPVRAGLWAVPATASATGVMLADTTTEAVVYGITPMAMCIAAEGFGLVARRMVVYRTRVDVEAQRRNAAIMRRIAYHRARAERHPWKWVQSWSALVAWWLMRRAGEGDAQLGVELIGVQRVRLTAGADLALGDMLAVGPPVPALPTVEPAQRVEREPAREPSAPPAIHWFTDDEPDPEPGEPEPHQREPEPDPGEPARLALSLTKPPALRAGEQQTGAPGASPAHSDREPVGDQQREPDDEREADDEPESEPSGEREPEPPLDIEQIQIIELATRIRNGERLTKTNTAPLLGVSPATAGRRLAHARRVVKLADWLKAGDRLTPSSAALLLDVDEVTAGARLTEAHQLNGEGQGSYA
ncbi:MULTISPECIES: conjugal transfer protein [Streptomyces]|uniref:Conjugal transfer protein n=1 Tax=Streptomyces canarius TaxID=285453 RepID=A0ABQ3CFP5_9ACTN|nr:conjugal transfer protein [Streptomyces canarius]GHA08730.1 hypothetical protein GCM10010345_11350 [Streptomyces canarius]